jgi:hypothetical protein
VSMAIEDSLNKKLLDRLLLELKKSGTVSHTSRLIILRLIDCAISGLCAYRHVYPLTRGQAAKYGRHRGPHVYYTGTRGR